MNYKQNDRVLVKGIPATVVRHENYQLPNGKIISSVRVQVFDANKGWQEFDADESIVEPDNSKNQ